MTRRNLARTLHDVAGHRVAVVHRDRIRHAADGGEAARRRGFAAGLDGFGMLDARLAQMHVHVDEARRYDLPGCIENLRAFGRQVFADGSDQAVFD